MPIDPHLAGLLELIAAAGNPPMSESTPEQARHGFRMLTVDLRDPASLPQVASVEDITVPGGDGPRQARVYRPVAEGPLPTIVMFHGGGFVIGDLDTHDLTARTLATGCDAVVVSVDYRLAPEHPWPAGVEDAVAATRWAASSLSTLGGDDRLAVAGDSAGGNISAVLALLARDGIAPAVVFQLLLYPAVDMNMDAPSFARIPDDYPLSPSVARWFRDHYMSDTKQHTDWRASPLHAESHHGVAPAFVLTARHDPLCDEGAAYAKKLEDAGVRVWQLDMNDQLHGFLTWGKMVRAADAALEMAAATLRYAFSTAK